MATATTCRSDESIFPPWAVLPDPHPALKMAGRGVSLVVDGVAIANFQTIDSSGGEAERIDVTTHDTAGRYREFRPSFASELNATFNIIYDPTHISHKWLAHLFQTGETVPCIVQIWNRELPEPGAEILFDAFVSAFPMPSFPIDGPYELTVQLTLTGDISFPGMDETLDPGPVVAGFRGCPGIWLPTESAAPAFADLNAPNPEDGSEDAVTLPAIRPYPSVAWPDDARIVTSDNVDATWDGTAWVEWSGEDT